MRYIIIGYGNIGKKRKGVLGEKCVATVDPTSPEADYKDYRDAPLSDFDAAILATPDSVKFEILKYLLENGKHSLVEKPLFLEKSEMDTLRYLALKKKVIWYTSYNHRFETLILKLKQRLEEKSLGQIYFGNFVYGNGTVGNIVNHWRDRGNGVLEDLGCHLMDLATYLLPSFDFKYRKIRGHSFEARSCDYFSFVTMDGRFQFLCSSLIWKNTFRIEIYGSRGSLHLDGLCKWGESQLVQRERIFPSGVPWSRDIEYFEGRMVLKETSYENDLYLSDSIRSMILGLQ